MFSYTVRNRIAEVTIEGGTSRSEIRDLKSKLDSDAEVNATTCLLVEVRELEGWTASREGLQDLAELWSAGNYGEGRRCAVIVDRPLLHGFARLVGVYSERHGVAMRVFWDRDEALRWLRRP
ncbi:MAG: STAS/SEC14 domain-containing protein [Deltaproteobacteria bacterium]|nr:STAS/SEC14 domain-containing protein [Deltaproteobacteria bacterium]MBW2420325.1 STAS/SEC14 domain-containing protein [Deltaproteobacteria bacterium]